MCSDLNKVAYSESFPLFKALAPKNLKTDLGVISDIISTPYSKSV